MSKPNPLAPTPPPPPPSSLFNRASLECFQDGHFTVFDYDLKNALLFSQGSWSLIRRDLTLAGIDPACISSLEEDSKFGTTGPCAGLMNAFRVRKELIHYKKVCLHLFLEARRIERDLKQAMAFFFWFDGDDPANGNRVHLEAICESHVPSSSSSLSSSSRIEAALREAAVRHAEPSACTLLDRKRLYVLASATWMYHRGILRAIQDARDVAKAICMSPRHPNGEANGERPAKLADLPGSMYVKQACVTAARDDPKFSRGERRQRHATCAAGNDGNDGNDGNGGDAVQKDGKVHPKNVIIIDDNANNNGDNNDIEDDIDDDIGDDIDAPCAKKLAPPPRGYDALQSILEEVRSNLSWSPEAIDFLSKCIIARGGFKALAIIEELQHYHRNLSILPTEIETVLEEYTRAQSDMVRHLSEHDRCPAEGETPVGKDIHTDADIGSAAVNRHRHIHHLRGALDACRENAKWVDTLERMARNDNDHVDQREDSNHASPTSTTKERLFVASDDLSSGCAFVPRDFQLGSFVAESRRILDAFLLPAMRAALTVESWPPAAGTRRTRVLAFDRSTIGDAVVGRKKLHPCSSCEGMFDFRWIRMGLCSICEDVRRRERRGTMEVDDRPCCLFETCKFRSEAYCPHLGRCFVCDAPYSCERLCRLSRGNGEVATTLVETLQPRLLLIDFDRTLCSTKSGASPLPQRRGAKEGYAHTIDPDLRIAIAAQRAYGSSYVVTRNSNIKEIQMFLKMHGMEELANNVHVVPKKKAKGAFIREHFFNVESSWDESSSTTGEDGRVCLFIDDDIRELVSDPWMRSNEQVHRLLFSRAFNM